MNGDSISIYELNQLISNAVASFPGLKNVWVVGETCDVRVSGGHCYLELVEKDDRGGNRSRIRALMWANVYNVQARKFREATRTAFASGLKIRARVTASYHPSYGMSVTISELDPAYTLGDAMRRRAEILERLTRENILNNNRQLHWAVAPNRIAVISARGAAGYGDFINQLFTNARNLRFSVEFFPAIMQGENTVPTVLKALEAVWSRKDDFDIVVIIRGGGATSDLSAFDSYEMASAIARFPIPVITGIGHERDVTVLDYVANTRVNTPTAAAELLIDRLSALLDALGRAADSIYRSTVTMIADNRELLAHAEASLPGHTAQLILKQQSVLDRLALGIGSNALTAISIRREKLAQFSRDIVTCSENALKSKKEQLDRTDQLLRVLSPDAVLRRGFSLTLFENGTVVRNVENIAEGTTIVTRFADGSLKSKTLSSND